MRVHVYFDTPLSFSLVNAPQPSGTLSDCFSNPSFAHPPSFFQALVEHFTLLDCALARMTFFFFRSSYLSRDPLPSQFGVAF